MTRRRGGGIRVYSLQPKGMGMRSLLALLTAAAAALAGSVFVTDYEYQADIPVCEVEYEYQADLCVYPVEYEYQADDEDGLWYFCDYEYQADFTVCYVDYEYQADLKIYFVDYEYQAGWEESSEWRGRLH